MTKEQDAAFFRTLSLVLMLLMVIGVAAAILGRYFGTRVERDTGDTVAQRIAPVGQVNTDPNAMLTAALPVASPAAAIAAAPAAPAEEKTAPVAATGSAGGPTAGRGKQIYDTVCFACHAAGVAGAPKFSDKDAWAPRIAQGKDTLYKHALEGFFGKNGLMPPKGGRADLADEDVKAAVDYLTAAAQ